MAAAGTASEAHTTSAAAAGTASVAERAAMAESAASEAAGLGHEWRRPAGTRLAPS